MIRILLWACLAAVVLYSIVVAGLYVVQRRLLFVPDINTPDPARAGVPGLAVVRVPTADGLSLIAWYVPPAKPTGFTVLLLHGNAGNIAYRSGRLRAMQQIGWGVLLLEYRGYGGNSGAPSEDGLVLDAQAGLAELHRRGVPAERILLWGESLGTGLAVRLASENPVAAVLLDAPYTSIADAAQGQYPYVPVRLLLKDRFESLSRIPLVRAPILVMQGSADRLVPPAMGRAMIAAATVPTELWVAEGAGHEDLGPYGAVEAAAAFVRDHCR
jgi:fermentation-respiration switch protein FrsA (DUF1100 family)